MFKIIKKEKKTKARIGIIKTKKGNVETPFFMPVSTKAVGKYINSEKLNELSVATISNALILSIAPGTKVLKKFGGIGKFMNYNGINITDSGGFQMYTGSIYISSNEKGVWFKNPFSGEQIFMTPEKDMQIQIDINSEVAMCLDRMPLYSDSKDEIKKSVELTTIWAKRCKIEHDKLQKKKKGNEKQLLFGITQGGIYPDLRKKSVKDLLKIGFDGYSIGGLGLGESKREQDRIVELQRKMIPMDKPIYLMGIGDPVEIVNAIAKGIDMFDSKMPTQNARRGTLFTSKGKIRIMNKEYEFDKKPIDSECKCFVCKNYSKAYVRYLLRQDESVGKELASYHNLFYLKNLIEESKLAIRKGKFFEFKRRIEKVYRNN